MNRAEMHRTDRRCARAALAAGLAVGLSASSAAARPPAARWEPPRRLAETGLYSDAARHVVSPGVLPYEPQYPLWTDGARKRRWIRLPPGAFIDGSDPDGWVFPVGTRLWKEFAWGRRVETRYMELGRDWVWHFATYLWNEDQSDATLAPERGLVAAHEFRSGVWHDVPGRADCLTCHEGGRARVLGFNALQLSPDRDPGAPGAATPAPDAVDLRRLAEMGLVRGLPPAALEHPPRIEAPTARARAALGYLQANCGVCHNSSGPLSSLGLSLEYPLATRSTAPPPAVETTVGRASRFRLPAAGGEDGLRIAPGDPERSVLLRRMVSRNPIVQMPPLGTHAVDEEAAALVSEWIRLDLVPGRSSATQLTRKEEGR
jgi:hypothetical protein